jgi:excisionase family DNA binding protein
MDSSNRASRKPGAVHLFTVEEAGFYLGRSVWSMRHLIADGEIAIVRNGRRIFLDRSDLDSFVEQNRISYG